MRTLTDVTIGINGKIHYADVMVRGIVSEKTEWILGEFKKLPLHLQEKMLSNLEILRKKKCRYCKYRQHTKIN